MAVTEKKQIRTDLKRVSTYAREQGISTTWVYKLAEEGKLTIVEIDGVKFVKATG